MANKMILTQSLSDNNNIRPTTPDGDVSTHGESTTYNTVNEERTSSQQASERNKSISKNTSNKKIIHRTSSRDRGRPIRSDSSNLYELSSDIADKAIECLENKYGGKEKSNNAAKTIQHYYRHFMLSKGFLRVRAYSGRRRSLTMPEKQFQLLRNKSLVFYGPENPVMIVDCEFEMNNIEPNSSLEDSTEDSGEVDDDEVSTPEEKPDIMELAKEEGMRMCSQSTVDSDDNDETLIGETATDDLEDDDNKSSKDNSANDNELDIEDSTGCGNDKTKDDHEVEEENVDCKDISGDGDDVSLGDKVEVIYQLSRVLCFLFLSSSSCRSS